MAKSAGRRWVSQWMPDRNIVAHTGIALVTILILMTSIHITIPTTGWIVLLVWCLVAHQFVGRLFVGNPRQSAKVSIVLPKQIMGALDQLPHSLILIDENGRITFANRVFAESVDLNPRELVGVDAVSLPWIRCSTANQRDFPWQLAITENQVQVEQLIQYQIDDGELRFFAVNASPVEMADGSSIGALVSLRDVTRSEAYRAELEQAFTMLQSSHDKTRSKNRELELLANQDPLTGCWNRRSLVEQFQNQWEVHQENGSPMACIMIDVDHFKETNDIYGHPFGDEVLRSIAGVLQRCFPVPFLAARYGGEEFCVMMPETSIDTALGMAEQARRQIENTSYWQNPEYKTTASIGVSVSSAEMQSYHDLIKTADACLYRAKELGRNRIVSRQATSESHSSQPRFSQPRSSKPR